MPALTVLQLDTNFARIAGDVASQETYNRPIICKKIAKASVARIVQSRPDLVDITPFEEAIRPITEGITTTSCGYLGYWQDHLEDISRVPILTSVLCQLPEIHKHYAPHEIAILTFNADILGEAVYAPMLNGFAGRLIGLEPHHHLRCVIENDLTELDPGQAGQDLIALLTPQMQGIKVLVLECTNLPPYKQLLKDTFNIAVFDILNALEAIDEGLVKEEFL